MAGNDQPSAARTMAGQQLVQSRPAGRIQGGIRLIQQPDCLRLREQQAAQGRGGAAGLARAGAPADR